MSKTKNPNIAQKVINRPNVLGAEFSVEQFEKEEKDQEKAEASAKEKKIQSIANHSRKFQTIAEEIAQDKFQERNHRWPGAKEAFPFNKILWTVHKFFPYAQGGPLFVDEPTRKEKLDTYKIKQEAMKKLGHRYLILTEGMKYHEALEALA